MRAARIAIAGGLLATSLVACGGSGSAAAGGKHPRQFQVTGEVVLQSLADVQSDGSGSGERPCRPGPNALGAIEVAPGSYRFAKSKYEDIPQGEVLITDGQRAIIGKTNLGPDGTLRLFGEYGCVYTFSLSLPDRDFYTFSVAGRPGPTLSRQELQDRQFKVDVVLS